MAEQSSASQDSGGGSAKAQNRPVLLIILVVINMAVVLAAGFMVLQGRKKDAAKPTVDDVIKGEHEAQQEEAKVEDFEELLVPLETFVVNLAQSRGRKLAKVNMEFEVDNQTVKKEIADLKPKIRDIIIIILSSKTYSQVSTKEGKDDLREEIRDKVNLFLTKGRIVKVLFTEFIYN